MAKPTRRSVLRAGVLAVAAAAPLGGAQQALSVVAGGMASGLRRSTFAPHRRTAFTLSDGGGSYRAVLTEIGDHTKSTRGHEKKFRLLFQVSGAPPAGTYRLSHGAVRAMDLFVTPVGSTGGLYEAVVDAR